MATFKGLDVFQRAILMAKYIYTITSQFPDKERMGMTAQLQRAAVSIPAILAEGTSRRTTRDRQQAVDIALGALNEIYAQLLVAKELKYLQEAEVKRFERGYDALRPKLIAYQRSIQPHPDNGLQ
jgi:four helix bundle protein